MKVSEMIKLLKKNVFGRGKKMEKEVQVQEQDEQKERQD